MLRVIVVGLGPIGLACARAVRAERVMKLAGLVDLDPAKRGKTLAELVRQAEPAAAPAAPAAGDEGPSVMATLAEAASGGADAVVITTASDFAAVAPTLREALRLGLAAVSSCEEMAWPWYRHAALADEIDAAARETGRALLGTGVNPGFAMDTLAVVLAGMVRRVSAVRCERRVEAGLRRAPLQAKIGATLGVERFKELAAAGKIGHAGLAESVALLAAGLGRTVVAAAGAGGVETTLEPVVAESATPSSLGLIHPGRVAGIRNTARWSGDGLRIELDLTMAVGLPDPRDTVTLEGPVQVHLQIPGGLPGDSATVAALVNHLPLVHAASPGLLTMLDMPPAGSRGRDR